MRIIITLVSLLVVSLLVFQSYRSQSIAPESGLAGDAGGLDPRQKAADVNRLIEDAALRQRDSLERQLGQ